MNSPTLLFRSAAIPALSLCATLLRAQTNTDAQAPDVASRIHWLKGPTTADMRGVGQIQVPAGYVFADAATTRKLLEAGGNPTSGAEMGLLTTSAVLDSKEPDWFLVFEFENVGYVKDDDKDKLNADKVLKSLKDGNDAANEYRAKRGIPPLNITGWEQPPKYNPDTHNLEWAIRCESEGRPSINYNTRVLGRKGVMSADLVVDPDKLAGTLATYQSLLAGYHYDQGETYAEYRPGDKIAKYGLAGLIAAGAGYAAVKTGLLAVLLKLGYKIWIAIVAGVAWVINGIRRLVTGDKPRKSDTGSPPSA